MPKIKPVVRPLMKRKIALEDTFSFDREYIIPIFADRLARNENMIV